MAAIGRLDEAIALIRASGDGEGLCRSAGSLSIDAEQAKAILDMRLQKLTGLELDSIGRSMIRWLF